MKKKFLMTTAAAVLSLGVITACGGAEEDPMLEDPAVEDPAMEEAPMDEPITDEPALDDEEFGEEEIDVDVEGEETGDEFAEEEEEEATN